MRDEQKFRDVGEKMRDEDEMRDVGETMRDEGDKMRDDGKNAPKVRHEAQDTT